MRGFLELVSLISMFVMLGAVIYAAFHFLSVSSEFGDGSGDLSKGTYQGLRSAFCGAVVFWIASVARKRV